MLSEIPAEWQTTLDRWTRLNQSIKHDIDGPAPDAADEIMLYQTLVAAWPLDLSPTDRDGLQAFGTRVFGWFEKALREGKRRSGWAVPNADYETACHAFLDACLDPARPLAAELSAFANRLAVPGAINGLSQAMLRLTCPGICDLYQGTEYWDFSLVDPDNRRPVDFPAREHSLAVGDAPADLMSDWRDGRVKQAIIARTLALREQAPGLFTTGLYTPLQAEGAAAHHIFAFLRTYEGRAAIVITTRLPASLGLEGAVPVVQPSQWRETSLQMPRNLIGRSLVDRLGSAPDAIVAPQMDLQSVLSHLPVALLEVR